MGESPRWHDGRFWMCDWLAGEVLAFDADGDREVVAPGRGAAVLDRLAARRPARRHHAAAAWWPGRTWRRTAQPGSRSTRSSSTPPGRAWVDMPGAMPWEEPKPGIVAVVLPDGTQPPGGRRRVVPERDGRPRRRHARGGRVARRPADRVDDHRRRRAGRPPGLGRPRTGLGPGRHLRRRRRGDLVRQRSRAALRPRRRGRRGARRRSRPTAAASRACSAATTAARCTSSPTTTARRAPPTASCSPTASTYRGPAGPEPAL